jgi:hypothetical protein
MYGKPEEYQVIKACQRGGKKLIHCKNHGLEMATARNFKSLIIKQ